MFLKIIELFYFYLLVFASSIFYLIVSAFLPNGII